MIFSLTPGRRAALALGVAALALAGPALPAQYDGPAPPESTVTSPAPGAPYWRPDTSNTGRAMLAKAWEALGAGDFSAAETQARGIVGLAPGSPDAWYLLGLALANQERLEPAIEALDRAAALFQVNAGPLTVKGDLLLAAGRRDEAEAAYLAAAERDPGDWRSQEQLGAMAEQDGAPLEAVRRYELALAQLPADRLFPRARLAALYDAGGRPEAAPEVLAAYVLANPLDPEGLKALGRAQIRAGRFGEAMASLDKAVGLVPEDIDARLAKAAAEIGSGAFDAAQATLDAAGALEPASADVAFVRGRLEMARGNPEEAAALFRQAMSASGEGAGGALYLAEALISAGDSDQALRTLEEAAGDGTAPAQVLLTLGELQASLGDLAAAESSFMRLAADYPQLMSGPFRLASIRAAQGRYEEALADYAAGLDIAPADPSLLRGAAVAAARVGDVETSLDYGDRLIEASQRSAPSMMLLAWLREQAGEADAAEAAYREILDAAPQNVGALNNLAVLLLSKGGLEEAGQLAETATRIDPNASFAWHTAGEIQQAAGQLDESAKLFGEAVRLAPENPDYLLDWGIALMDAGAVDQGKAIIGQSLEMGLSDTRADLARSRLK